MEDQAFFSFQAQKSVGIGQSMDQPEEKGEKIDQGQSGRMFYLPGLLDQVVDRGSDDGQRDQEFDPAGRNMHEPCCAQGQGNGMADGKGGNEHHHLFPVLYQVAQAQCCHKQDMIQGFPGEDMFCSQSEIKVEILHIVRVVKIIQTFVA